MRSRREQTVGEHRLEACADVARRRKDRHRHGVEGKHAPAAAARLHLRLGRFDDRVNDLEGLASSGSDESADGAIECAGELRLEVSGLSQKIHVAHFPIRPAATAALTISPAAGAAVMPAVARMLDHDGECDPLLAMSMVRTAQTRRTSRANRGPKLQPCRSCPRSAPDGRAGCGAVP